MLTPEFDSPQILLTKGALTALLVTMLIALILAALPVAICDTVSTISTCNTKMVMTSVNPVPTSTTSKTSTYTVKKTVKSYPTITVTASTTRTLREKTIVFSTTKTVTVSPPGSTTTVTQAYTVRQISYLVEHSADSVNQQDYQTETFYPDPTYTVTDTIGTASTSLLPPTLPSFTPIQSDPRILAEYANVRKRSPVETAAAEVGAYLPRRYLQARQASPTASGTPAIGAPPPSGAPAASPPVYPKSVGCTISVRSYISVTTTVPGTTRTSTYRPSTTVTTTSTSKVAATIIGTVPQVTETVTSPTTSTVTVTGDPGPAYAQTTVVDPNLPVVTQYPECLDNNVVVDGPQGSIKAWVFTADPGSISFQYGGYPDWQGCCGECVRNQCQQWVWNQGNCFAAVTGNEGGRSGAHFFDSTANFQGIGFFGNGNFRWQVRRISYLLLLVFLSFAACRACYCLMGCCPAILTSLHLLHREKPPFNVACWADLTCRIQYGGDQANYDKYMVCGYTNGVYSCKWTGPNSDT